MPVAPGRPLVGIALPPGPEFAGALDEAWRTGAAVVPLDPAAPAAERERVLAELRLDDGVADDIALVIATSGSTGRPKGVELSELALAASARGTMARIGVRSDDVWLSCLPWHHIGGLQVLLRARLFETPLVVHDRFDVDRVAAEPTATLVSLVPTQLRRLLDAAVDISRFRAILLGGAAAPGDLLARAKVAGARVVTTYGMSETCGGCVYDGVPLDDVSVRLGPDGRVLIRGPVLMSGYRLRPDLTAETLVDGELWTQDLGAFDSDGRLVARGRIDDIVITGGENVVAAEVAERLTQHPHVRAAAVAGIPDPEWGERVVAVVVAEGEEPSVGDLRQWCRETLPAAALPREVRYVDAIPLLPSGKPDRMAIRRLLGH